MKLILSSHAARELDNLPIKVAENLYKHFNNLLKGLPNLDIKKLNVPDIYRLRVGNYRAIFYLNSEKQLIEILTVQHRKDIYKKRK